VRALVTDFDTTMPEVLSVSEALTKILNNQQPERMDNSDYVKTLLALIKVYEQYCEPYGVHHMEEK
jgi:sulfur relay (sulfurtransferase) DsrF/TusC family protein